MKALKFTLNQLRAINSLLIKSHTHYLCRAHLWELSRVQFLCTYPVLVILLSSDTKRQQETMFLSSCHYISYNTFVVDHCGSYFMFPPVLSMIYPRRVLSSSFVSFLTLYHSLTNKITQSIAGTVSSGAYGHSPV